MVGVLGSVGIDQVVDKEQWEPVEAILRGGVAMLSERTRLDFDMTPVMRRQDGLEDDYFALVIRGLDIEGHGPADGILGKGILDTCPSTAQTSAVEGLGLNIGTIIRMNKRG